jgi:cellulose synthase/poly-beta-1,6-N-acetylglucosamine synthase-like glycosyltransferase
VKFDLQLLNGYRPVFVVFDLWVLALVALVRPMVRDHGDDQGDGLALVLLPPPKLPHLARTFAFVAVFLTLVVAYHAYTGPYAPDALYVKALRAVADRLVLAPAQVDGFLANFALGLRVLVLATMVSLVLTCRATPLRRVSMLVQTCWYVAAVFLFDCLLIVLSVVSGLGVGPGTIFGNWFAIGVGFLAMARFLYANFALPGPTRLPLTHHSRVQDTVLLVATTVVGMCVSLTTLAWAYHVSDANLRAFLVIFAPVPFSLLTFAVRNGLLGLFTIGRARRMRVGPERPEIDVIIPAYNEEEVIVGTLASIDAAAAAYGGPVNVIMTDDGSTDATRPLAEASMAAFVAARGRIIDGPHGGKSAALNLALAETTADIVIRIDADTIIDEQSLRFVPRWFRDPEVGLVEALMWPRWESTPYHRFRLFEELRIFGLNHRLLQTVDAINVVPGVFTAFRRQPALDLGGFTVGMNGEDGDFTMRMSRLGYTSRLDPKVVVHEGVPESFFEVREQRIRWGRATIHNQSRHGIYRAGRSSPAVWFTQTNQYFRRVRSPIFFVLPLYVALYAVFQGAWRVPVVAAIAATFVGQALFMLISLVLAVGYGFARYTGWVVLWPVWRCCLAMFSTESLLSLPGRPLRPFTRRRTVIREAVVH